MCEKDITGQVPATSCYEAALMFALEHREQVKPGWKFTVPDFVDQIKDSETFETLKELS